MGLEQGATGLETPRYRDRVDSWTVVLEKAVSERPAEFLSPKRAKIDRCTTAGKRTEGSRHDGAVWQTLRRGAVVFEIRHALITRIGKEELFRNETANRYLRHGSIPFEYVQLVSRLRLSPGRTLDSARTIASDLARRRGRKQGPGISSDSVTALKVVCSGERGICSDVSQVFTGLCMASGIPVREWGVCEGFASARGHTFNEVYSTEHGKWVLLDVVKRLHFCQRDREVPLSVAELVDLVTASGGDQIEIVFSGPLPEQAEYLDGATGFYFNPRNVFFLIAKNNVFGQDVFLRWSNAVPLALLHGAMFLFGVYPTFNVYTNDATRRELAERLQAHRRNVGHMVGRLGRALVGH